MISFVTIAALASLGAAQSSLFQPCPLLGPYVPAPSIDPSSPELLSATHDFTGLLQKYIAAGDGPFGPISPNTTSFSIVLFGGNSVVSNGSPYFYEYHHTATLTAQPGGANHSGANGDAVYALGDLTELFTVFLMLKEEGDIAWDTSIVKYLPELEEQSLAGDKDPITHVLWRDVTLGALAGHMAGIARDGTSCRIDAPCPVPRFLPGFINQAPVYLPDTTPTVSSAGFQLIALALQRKHHQSFSSLLGTRILKPLGMTHSSLLTHKSQLFRNGLSNSTRVGSPAALSLLSTTHDLALAGRAMLTSSVITPAQTRRWLKPFTSTSNLRNAVGRPWEIYHYGNKSIDPIIDIYTKIGSLGRYSSYFGLAPTYDVGFAILAVDEVTDGPDLNAYADIVLYALRKIDALAQLQAQKNIAGTYSVEDANNSSLTVELQPRFPGLAVTSLHINGTDQLARIAKQASIQPADLDFRLYPTNLEAGRSSGGSRRQVYQAVVQDRNALVDAGTPTCISWMDVGELQIGGQPLDRLIFNLDAKGKATSVELKAFNSIMSKA